MTHVPLNRLAGSGFMQQLLKPQALLLLTLAGAFLLRAWGIGFGLPYEGVTYNQISYEESKEVYRAFKLGIGQYSWSFGKGGLYYILFVEYGVFFVLSWVLGWVHSARDFALHVLEDRTAVYLMGRFTVALMGTLTCLVIYEISRRLYDKRTGLIAAFIGATAYYHTIFSSVINVDIGMTLALWTSVLLYLMYEANRKPRLLLGAGALGAVAIAFKLPGAIALPFLCLAVAVAPGKLRDPRTLVKEWAMLFVALMVVLTIIAPEWTTAVPGLTHFFPGLFGQTPADTADATDLDNAIDSLTVVRAGGGLWSGYVQHLVSWHNVALTIAAAAGFFIGVWRKSRWDVMWGVFVIVFIAIMSASDRTQPERYLLPIMPALWLLSGRAVAAASRLHWSLMPVALVCIAAVPTFLVVRADYEKTHPDTRILAKQWIEANVPAGSKLLIDGGQYRLMHGPPLNGDQATVSQEVARASGEQYRARGLSDQMLDIYAEGLLRVKGPKYKLVSTVWGLALDAPSYYVQNCFDYFIESSYISDRFAPGRAARESNPAATQFYDEVGSDPRFHLVHRVEPVPWDSTGPTISIYRIQSGCPTGADTYSP